MAQRTRYTALCAAALFSVSGFPAHGHAELDIKNQYLSNSDLQQRIRSFAGSNTSVQTASIGTSLNGDPITLITLSQHRNKSEQHPALLITAGLDGRYLSSTEIAIRIAEDLVENHSDLLQEITVYIIPQVNPDGAAMNSGTVYNEHIGNARSTDDDRDRAADEDGPDDLNGDGLITMMRRLNPPLNDPATHLQDPENPLLNIEPDPKEDHRATFTLYPEGLDNDLDGSINEDGAGSVDLDSNFMHRWPEHQKGAGKYPLSEPESLALAEFVLSHDNIVMALTIGRHDNLVNQPDAKAKDITGTAPKAIDAKDAGLYKAIGEMYTEITGINAAPKEEIAGSFHAWLYAQRGIPSFAVVPWTRPAPEGTESESKNDDSESTTQTPAIEGNGLTPSGVGDISMETLDELKAAYEAQTGESVDESMIANITPEMVEGFAAQAGIEVRRVVEGTPAGEPTPAKGSKKKAQKKSDDQKWLDYFEQADIDGFVEWEPYEHPTLGSVEIGGFLPHARINPPASELDPIAQRMTAFVVKLIESRPVLNTVGPEVKELASGVYEIRFSVTNEGKVPTTTAHSRSSKSTKPTIVRLSSEVDQIITGQRVSRVWGIDPHGGRSDHHWIIRTNNINNERIEIIDPRFGNRTIELGR
ncbi:MAG: M14 family zinc carboxypeptidase [Phycisphaerales bacterium]